jgi:hypothetical protein
MSVRITRTLRWTYTVPIESYPGMTEDEIRNYEIEMEPDTIIETLVYTEDEIDSSCVVEFTE